MVLLKETKVQQLIQEIPSEQTALATHLQTLLDNDEFDRILQLMSL
jgi:hypothetical protein